MENTNILNDPLFKDWGPEQKEIFLAVWRLVHDNPESPALKELSALIKKALEGEQA